MFLIIRNNYIIYYIMENYRNYQGSGGTGRSGVRRSGVRRSGVRRSGGGYRKPVVRQTSTSNTLGGGPWWGWGYGYYWPYYYPYFEYNPFYIPYEVEVVEVEKKVEKKVENFESVKYVYPEFLK